FLLLVLPLLALALHGATAQRAGVVLISALAAHTAWHWMLERMDDLRFVQWPSLDLAWPAVAALAALLAAVGWGAVVVAGWRGEGAVSSGAAHPAGPGAR
ncbi:MAG TPA: hypothetical protein VFG43_12245, partial [Geminicoccaceae bacterium]|nr:hypothetical protein [Geminicoccaceae bacterium]